MCVVSSNVRICIIVACIVYVVFSYTTSKARHGQLVVTLFQWNLHSFVWSYQNWIVDNLCQQSPSFGNLKLCLHSNYLHQCMKWRQVVFVAESLPRVWHRALVLNI